MPKGSYVIINDGKHELDIWTWKKKGEEPTRFTLNGGTQASPVIRSGSVVLAFQYRRPGAKYQEREFYFGEKSYNIITVEEPYDGMLEIKFCALSKYINLIK